MAAILSRPQCVNCRSTSEMAEGGVCGAAGFIGGWMAAGLRLKAMDKEVHPIEVRKWEYLTLS